MHLFRFLIATIVVIAIPYITQAIDLFEAYEKAKAHDPEYLSVYYDYRATLTFPEQAVSGVLPQVNASFTKANYRFIKSADIYPDYSSEQTNVSMRQAIFNLPAIIEIKQADLRTKAAEARLKNAEQSLIRKVSEAYFDLLYAEEYLRVINEEKKAFEEQLRMAKKLLEAGEATLTDVHDAEARLYDAQYRAVDAEKNLYAKRKNLARIIGEEPSSLSVLAEKPPVESIIPSEPQSWIEIARGENPYVRFYQIQRDVAEDELRKQKAQWLPTLSIFSSYSRTDTRDYFYVKPLSYLTVGIQLNLNILSGGYITAKIKEARERVMQAEKDYEKAFSDVSQGVVESFFGVRSTQAGILSSEASVRASQLALDSTKKGYQAGIRTFVDILNAESNLYRAKLNFVKSVYDYVKSLVNLYFYAGILGEEHVLKINGWLKRRDLKQ